MVFAFLFVDLFDTLGGIMGMAAQSDLLDKEGRLPRLKGALLSDAVGTAAGAVLGTSTVTTFAESAAGMAEGGRTGLTGSGVKSVVVGASGLVSSPPPSSACPSSSPPSSWPSPPSPPPPLWWWWVSS